jgi:oxygen-dependent protoporphyrinogen oxidase
MPDATARRDPGGTGTRNGPATVVVVGGGIAGLSAAWALSSGAGAMALRIVVLESDTRLGGKLLSVPIGGRSVDLGPDAFLARRPEAVGLCDELGLADELVAPGSRTAYVWARRRLRPLPAGLALGVPTRLLPLARSGIVSPDGVARAALDLLGFGAPVGGDDGAVGTITRRHLGRQVTTHLVDPLIGGIHAGNCDTMSAAAVFPPLWAAGRRRGSLMRGLRTGAPGTGGPGAATEQQPVFLTLPGGMSQLVARLAEALRGRGVEIRTGRRVARLERRSGGEGSERPAWVVHGADEVVHADALIVATPVHVAAQLLGALDRDLGATLEGIDDADVTLVTVRVPEGSVRTTLDGTGFLVPRVGGGLVTACTWLTSKWPHLRRPGDVLLRASAGRFGDDRPAQLSDDDLVRRVLVELDPILGLDAPPLETVVTRWPGAFPQYATGHLERVAGIEAAVGRHPGLAMAGAALRGVGIPACIDSGRRAAAAVLEHVAASTGGSAP